MAWNVLVHNGVLQMQDPGPAQAFLRSQPPGVYTSTRTTGNISYLLLWNRHLERLAQSIKLLSKDIPHLFPRDPYKLSHFDGYLKSIVQLSLSSGLEKAIEVRTTNDEFIITTFVTGLTKNIDMDGHNGFDVYVHICRCIPLRSDNTKISAAHLAIMGPGRSFPNVKHSEWVRSRQVLEKARPEHVTEIVLSNDGDLLLEGMTTNFFVVVFRRSDLVMETRTSSDGKMRPEDIVLQTAPLVGVLPGVLRKLILEICEEQGITFEEVSPSWRGRHLWVEAFTSNSVRLIQPVGSIQCPVNWDYTSEPQNGLEKSWENYVLQEVPGHFTQLIQSHVESKSLLYSVPVDSLRRST